MWTQQKNQHKASWESSEKIPGNFGGRKPVWHATSACIVHVYTALSVLCLTDMYCARMANESRKCKKFSINEKMSLWKEIRTLQVRKAMQRNLKFKLLRYQLFWRIEEVLKNALQVVVKKQLQKENLKNSTFSVAEKQHMSWFAEARSRNIAIRDLFKKKHNKLHPSFV